VHLHLLSRLAFALRDAEFKKLIAQRGSQKEILDAARRVEKNVLARGATGKER
jgi:hypothetical protein